MAAAGERSAALEDDKPIDDTSDVPRIVARVRDSDSSGVPVVISFGAGCLSGRTYGQYVVPPVQSLDVVNSVRWLQAAMPRARVSLSSGVPPLNPGPQDLVLDCAAFPRRAHW